MTFDECFQMFPELNPPEDMDLFWKEAIKELKSASIKEEMNAPLKGRHIMETVYDVSFQSVLNYRLQGKLTIPRKRGDLPVLVYFHDYNSTRPKYIEGLTDLGIAHLIIDLRGHGDQLVKPQFAPEDKKAEQDWTPNYFTRGIDKKETFFLKYLYLDVLRTIEFLRLTKGIDGSKIYLHGKNLGAAMAVFGAAFSNRVAGLILETPGFCYVTDEQLKSEAAWAREIYRYMQNLSPAQKSKFRKNLAYFDTINMIQKIEMPVLFSCGLKDTVSTPKSIFALFNHMNGDKRMEVYPENGNNAGQKIQHGKNIQFLKEIAG